ncbi:TorF family putative porin [Thermochromatium tepidum]|uniref:Cellulose biosynthesis protein BcsS n=1 Tax=Thermochromatium tepidum ATCC 43061 TaxID=316276 RepID=A0A6I6E5Y5_THETI|nr:TorF family putative porin [Thermochromatium tepidum]QGU32083.1 hypothetical protein E6P07_03220 [Thermochromatium tepidum ATCC 43061]
MNQRALWLLAVAGYAGTAGADWSVTLTGASDYLFNGVTQTGHQPSAQAGLDWSGVSGLYAGLWASNVDFGDDTAAEVDGSLGYRFEFRPGSSVDVGLALYTYHGGGDSSESNYPEVYLKLGIAGVNLNLWYSHDYSGLGVGHLVVMLHKDFEINDRWTIAAQLSRSTSLDADRFAWDGDRDHYLHWQVMNKTAYAGFDLALGLSGTTLGDESGDPVLVFTMGRTFRFEWLGLRVRTRAADPRTLS